MSALEEVTVGGPWFEDFEVGQIFDDAPGLTLTAGHAALHQAIAGDRPAPLGDPLEVRLGDSRLSLRRAEASRVEVQLLP